jgi:hypothetical protein
MVNDKALPKWVKESLELLQNITSHLVSIKKSGQVEAKRGLEKAEKADALLNETYYLTNVLSNAHDPQVWNDEIITQSGIMMENRITLFNDDVESIQSIVTNNEIYNIENYAHFNYVVDSSGSSGGTAVYLGSSMENRFQAIEPSYNPIINYFDPKVINSRDVVQSELISILKPFGEKYIGMIEGSESALVADDPDTFSQGAHSMRDCFEEILKQLSPNKVVNSQPWFEPTPDAPGNVSRRSRLRYILYGSGEKIDEKIIKRFDELAEIAKNSLDICIKRAHDHDLSLTREETRLAIDQSRNSLLQILKRYIEFRRR